MNEQPKRHYVPRCHRCGGPMAFSRTWGRYACAQEGEHLKALDDDWMPPTKRYPLKSIL